MAMLNLDRISPSLSCSSTSTSTLDLPNRCRGRGITSDNPTRKQQAAARMIEALSGSVHLTIVYLDYTYARSAFSYSITRLDLDLDLDLGLCCAVL